MEWLSRLLFAQVQGRQLIYNTCWEDPALDEVALGLRPDDRVLVITSAGCNALHYLLAGAGEVHAVDVNPCQNALLALKVAALRALDDRDFFDLFGRGRSQRFPDLYRSSLRPLLPPRARRFWDRRRYYFSGRGWRNSFYYHGTFGTLARVQLGNARNLLGLGNAIDGLLAATTLEEQRDTYLSVQHRLWTPLTRWLCSRRGLLALIGIPWEQCRMIQEYPGGILQFTRDILEAVFTRLPLRDNYFWRVYLQGHYTPDCCPEYLRPGNGERLRGLLDRLRIVTATVADHLRRSTAEFSKFVLLDHMDWMNTFDRRGLADEWTQLLARARPGARAIFRSAGLRVTYLDDLEVRYQGRPARLGDLLRYQPEVAARLHEQDRVHMYGSFHIADLPG